MSTFTLLMIEISGIQDFIFSSNNLKVNVGASALVKRIAQEWIPEALPKPINIEENGRLRNVALENEPELAVEAIYLGGGNGLLLFREKADTVPFLQKISRKILEEAPGLTAVSAMLEVQWDGDDKDNLVQRYGQLRDQLGQRKLLPPKGLPQPGNGVTAAGVFTGLPAAYERRVDENDPRPTLYADAVHSKLNNALDEEVEGNASRPITLLEWQDLEIARNILGWDKLRLVNNFNRIGQLGESSYLAIVHADGNRMGERIKKLAKPFEASGDNRGFANALRKFSSMARDAAYNAVIATINDLARCYDHKEQSWHRYQFREVLNLDKLPKVELNEHENKRGEKQPLLPFRPLVLGGDDVTFVCDGRLGLALAQRYLEHYGKQWLGDEQLAVGRAGVAIVKTHFPFALGYQLAEALAEQAKKAGGPEGRVASLDWHFGVNGIVSSLSEMRGNRYKVRLGKDKVAELILRPYPLVGEAPKSWESFNNLVKAFQTEEKWITRRNKIKALQTALRGGAEETEAFLTLLDGEGTLPDIPNKVNFKTQGWMGSKTPYFDALEALDFFVPLDKLEGES